MDVEQLGRESDNLDDSLIQERLAAALQRAQETLQDIQGGERDIGDEGSDRDEPIIVPWESSPGREASLENQIASLTAALQRLDEGRYGICESCGRPIARERLDVLPDARLCIQCAREAEAG